MKTKPNAPVPPRETSTSDARHGYHTSSIDLRVGLEVSALPVHLVPPELLLELRRLRRCWDRASA